MGNQPDCLRRHILLCVLLTLFAIPVQAALISDASVVYNEGDGTGNHQLTGATGVTSISGYNSTTVPGLAASAYGNAEYGALHASAFAGTIGRGPADLATQARAGGGASWTDAITINGNGLTGLAYAHASYSITGSLNSLSDLSIPGSAGNSTIGAVITINPNQNNENQAFRTGGQLLSQNGVITISTATGLFIGTFEFDIPFTFGQQFQMFANLTAEAQALAASPNAAASGASLFDSSGHWGGISNVHLANGTLLSGYTLSSQSGFNWLNAYGAATAPIPEPETYGMLLAGLGLLGFVARRRNPRAA